MGPRRRPARSRPRGDGASQGERPFRLEISHLEAWIAQREGDLKAEKRALEQALARSGRACRDRAPGGARVPGREARRRAAGCGQTQVRARRAQGSLPPAFQRRSARRKRRRDGAPGRPASAGLRGPRVLDAARREGSRNRPLCGTNWLASALPRRPVRNRASRSPSTWPLDLREPIEFRRRQPNRSARTIVFQDDAAAAGLAGFVFDSGASPSGSFPRCPAAESASLTTTATDSSMSIAIQGGRFPAAERTAASGDRLFRNRRRRNIRRRVKRQRNQRDEGRLRARGLRRRLR